MKPLSPLALELSYLVERAHAAIGGPAHAALLAARGPRLPNPKDERVDAPVLSVEALLARSRCASIAELARRAGVSEGSLRAARWRGGLSVRKADELAVRLGLHPVLVWGDGFYEAAA